MSIAVTFHAIVPYPLWEWESATSHMHIRFGDDALGSWHDDCGEMKEQRLVKSLICITVAINFSSLPLL